MTVRAYVLIECDATGARAVSDGLRHLAVDHAEFLSADACLAHSI